eukprot:436426_1
MAQFVHTLLALSSFFVLSTCHSISCGESLLVNEISTGVKYAMPFVVSLVNNIIGAFWYYSNTTTQVSTSVHARFYTVSENSYHLTPISQEMEMPMWLNLWSKNGNDIGIFASKYDSEKNQLNLSSIVWGTLLYTVQVDLTMSTSRVIQNQTLIGNLQEIHNSSIGWFQSKLIDSTTKFIYIYNVKSKQPQPFFVYFAFLFGIVCIVCIVWIGSSKRRKTIRQRG